MVSNVDTKSVNGLLIHRQDTLSGAPEIGLHISNFHFTARMWNIGASQTLKIKNALLDSGATSNLVTPSVVREFGLTVYHVKPVTSRIADDSTYVTSEMVTFHMVVSGMRCRIVAYVTPFERRNLLTIGNPGMRALRVKTNVALGRKQETRVTVAGEKTRARMRNVVVEPTHGTPRMQWEQVSSRMWFGETATEKKNRLAIAFHRARYWNAMAREQEQRKCASLR